MGTQYNNTSRRIRSLEPQWLLVYKEGMINASHNAGHKHYIKQDSITFLWLFPIHKKET